jgi:hypothetical protein
VRACMRARACVPACVCACADALWRAARVERLTLSLPLSLSVSLLSLSGWIGAHACSHSLVCACLPHV